MMLGAFGYRLPPAGWQPPRGAVKTDKPLVTSAHVHVNTAIRTPQFWLLWGVLCLNVSAGIGVIGMASPMLQEVFGGQLIGVPARLAELAEDQRTQVATIAAAFAGLLSLFNIAGRIGWASASDVLGRKLTYTIFFLLGLALYVSAPSAGAAGRIGFFVVIFCVILTMYGGGFATVPAYLADLFGTQHVGAIHGRLLTAWAAAGVAGPLIVNGILDSQGEVGKLTAADYHPALLTMVAVLAVGFVANLLIRPVAERFHEKQTAAAEGPEHDEATLETLAPSSGRGSSSQGRLLLSWLLVVLLLGYGVVETLTTAAKLFG
jgi:MFS family permease